MAESGKQIRRTGYGALHRHIIIRVEIAATNPVGSLKLTGVTNVGLSGSVITDPSAVVEALLHAVMRDKNFDAVAAILADDAVYENVGYPTMRGGRRIVDTFRRMSRTVPWLWWDVKIHRIVSEGSTVLTERTDAVIIGRFQAHFWVCGVFEVRNGRITLWRDYFDIFDMLKGTARALIAMTIPSLRRSL